jgi:hypothetical protein
LFSIIRCPDFFCLSWFTIQCYLLKLNIRYQKQQQEITYAGTQLAGHRMKSHEDHFSEEAIDL